MEKLHLAAEEVRRITTGKEDFMPLLLEADPSEAMIRRYLDDGEMYLLSVHGNPACVAVVKDGELMNLATAPELRGMGCATRLMNHVFERMAPRYRRLRVGTSPANVPFYHRLGFVRDGLRKNFFTDNYPEPIIEDGEVLTDMIMMSRRL